MDCYGDEVHRAVQASPYGESTIPYGGGESLYGETMFIFGDGSQMVYSGCEHRIIWPVKSCSVRSAIIEHNMLCTI